MYVELAGSQGKPGEAVNEHAARSQIQGGPMAHIGQVATCTSESVKTIAQKPSNLSTNTHQIFF